MACAGILWLHEEQRPKVAKLPLIVSLCWLQHIDDSFSSTCEHSVSTDLRTQLFYDLAHRVCCLQLVPG